MLGHECDEDTLAEIIDEFDVERKLHILCKLGNGYRKYFSFPQYKK